MNKPTDNACLLQLLVRVYNQSIQSYHHFPDVIICGHHRLEREEFDFLLANDYIEAHYADSFGKLYHTSKKAEALLHENMSKRRHRLVQKSGAQRQGAFPF